MTHKGPTPTLEVLRSQALAQAEAATDPLIRQQLLDLAGSYAQASAVLGDKGIAIVPPHAPELVAWRSVPMWCSNDR